MINPRTSMRRQMMMDRYMRLRNGGRGGMGQRRFQQPQQPPQSFAQSRPQSPNQGSPGMAASQGGFMNNGGEQSLPPMMGNQWSPTAGQGMDNLNNTIRRNRPKWY